MSGAEEEDNHDESSEIQTKEVSGWADAMSKILGSSKPKKKKNLILSRAKKDYEVKKSTIEKETVEVVVDDKKSKGGKHETEEADTDKTEIIEKNKPLGEIKKLKKKRKRTEDEEVEDGDEDVSLKTRHKQDLQNKRMRKEWENLNRSIPDSAVDRETERELMKIASKGVVELFNAVELQKKKLGKKLRGADKSEFKRDKILSETKDLFEDALETVSKKRR